MSTRNLKHMPGASVTRKRSAGKNHNKIAKEPAQETNIDDAWNEARKRSANAKQGKPNSNSANNIRLEYPDVVLDFAEHKKTSNTVKKQKRKPKPKGPELKMRNLFVASNN